MIEREVTTLRETQDREITSMQKRIRDLQLQLDEANANLMKRNEIMRETEVRAAQQETALNEAVRLKDREIRELKRQLTENEEEIKVLVYELERQKRVAKENIEKLNQLFK
eukprot:TRINITY_DN12105_c0_g1_i3.p1 TRINITY_DN12105_c0_g1~~TRINITY_DN12105_c0_g1_i3.p1  ORF type:complete len:111 (+),score=41.90 TRINITY_DN12105_c0_g1_i3:217-549(+)